MEIMKMSPTLKLQKQEVQDSYRGINNKNPPLRIFGLRISTQVFIIFKKSDKNRVRFLLFKKKSACGGLLLFYFSPKTKFGIVFGQSSRFCLKNTQKNRLRRAGGSALIIFPKFSACGGLLLFLFSQNFLALIIFLKSSRNFLLLLLFYF